MRPNANSSHSSVTGMASLQATLSPTSTHLEETVIRVRRRGHLPNAVSVVCSPTSNFIGLAIVNGTFDLEGGANPTVPTTYAFTFIDTNASITAGDIDVSYMDDTDTPRVDNFDIIGAGLGPHYTSFPVKSITSVVGQNFVDHTAADLLIGGPAVPDTLDAVIGTSAAEDGSPASSFDGGNDGDASFVESVSTSDEKIYVGFPNISQFNPVTITSIAIQTYVKQFAGGSGIDLLFRIGDGDSDWNLQTHTIATSTETGAVAQFFTSAITTNPKTGNPWTVQEIDDIQIGYIFRGDGGAIIKRVNFVRLDVNYTGGFVSDTVDGTDPDEQVNAYQALNKDPFTTPSSAEDLANHVPFLPGPSDLPYVVHFEDLPGEAVSVISTTTNVRHTYRNNGEKNGAGVNDIPCGQGVAQGGTEETGRQDGPQEAGNIGGALLRHVLGTTIIGPRFALGYGDPPAGCGTFNNFVGSDLPWGTFEDKSFTSVLNSGSNPITVANINAMTAGYTADDPNRYYQLSRIYAEVEFRSNPVGGSFYHLVVDDDPVLSPDDTDYMQSKHPSNKKFGVDFAGIPEVLGVNSVKVIARAGVETTGSAQGWRIIWRDGIGNSGSDVVESIVNNVGFSNFEYERTISPFTSEPWTRDECNRLVVIWEAIGENDFFEKRISGLIVEMDVDLIPDKIDSARNTGSRRLRLLRKPVPFLEVGLPPQFADVRILGDMTVNHNAIPRIAETLGFERWDKSLFRAFKKRIGHATDIVTITGLDMREFMSTLWVTGQTRTRGQSADGMAVLTPGVNLQFIRATNDYQVAPAGDLLQELNGDEPPTGLDGILIQNSATNLLSNSAFSEGAPNVFTEWDQLIGAGGAVAENLEAPLFEDDVAGNAPRSIELTTPTTPSDGTILQQETLIERGDSGSPLDVNYVVSVWHKDNDDTPLSVAVQVFDHGFATENFNWLDGDWASTGGVRWFDLPLRSVPTYDRCQGSLQNMHDIPGSVDPVSFRIMIGNRDTTGNINTVYAAQVEGGTLQSKTAARYPTNFILTRNGPVVRDGMQFFINNEAQRPVYPANLRGTFAIEFVPLWDSADLPRYVGARRYVYGFVVDAFNEDSFYYDSDTESFVFLRKIAGVSKSVTLFYPQVTRGLPVQVATRWISELGDLGETPFSFSFFINDQASPSDAHVQAFPLPSSKPLYIGSRDGTDGEMIDAVVRKLEIKQLALPQAAIPRLFT